MLFGGLGMILFLVVLLLLLAAVLKYLFTKPRAASLDEVENPELADMGRRFRFSTAFALPVFLVAMKAAVMVLSTAYPNALPYAELLAATRRVLADLGAPAGVDEIAFGDALFRMVMIHGVMPTVSNAAYATEPGEQPCAHALARLQATSPGWVVSGARHVAMDLDEPGRVLLGMLDGRRSIDDLVEAMRAMLEERGWQGPRETVRELTWQQLWLFARQGLLVR